jgi:hypothetical protein
MTRTISSTKRPRRLRHGEWIDPTRGRVALRLVTDDWFDSRHSVKRTTREADRAAWKSHIEHGSDPGWSSSTCQRATGPCGAGRH